MSQAGNADAMGLVPPPVDWEEATLEELEGHLSNFESLFGGRGHTDMPNAPIFSVDEDRPYLQNALGITTWALRMTGLEHDDANIFRGEVASHLSADRFFYFWHMYKRYYVFQLENEADVERDRDVIRRLSYCYEICGRVDRIQAAVHDLYRLQLNTSDFAVPDTLTKSSTHQSLLKLWSNIEDPKKKTDYEILLLYLLECAAVYKYRKQGCTVFEEKYVTYAGRKYGTRSWEPANFYNSRGDLDSSTIDAFIHRFCRKENKYEMWSRLVNLKGSDKLKDYLMRCDDIEFPYLKPCRHILAFENGIYDTREGTGGAFFDYSIVSNHLKSDVVAAKFFNMKIEESWLTTARNVTWWDIPTPFFQSILDYQNWGVPSPCPASDSNTPRQADVLAAKTRRVMAETSDSVDEFLYELKHGAPENAPEIMEKILNALQLCTKEADAMSRQTASDCSNPPGSEGNSGSYGTASAGSAGACLPVEAQKWIYIFLGRMLHALGDYDSWQIIPFFKGRGGSGKSTVAHVAKSFFAASDVGILSNNSEKKFGLQALMGKLVFICFELKKNISLDQAEFQSMVSGEEVCVAVKNQEARTTRWTIPGLLCGNEAPGWIDAQGSIARRLAIFGFKYAISDKHSDPELLQRILTIELAALIVKCNSAYRDAATRHEGEDIWKILPAYFRDERRSLQRDTDPLSNALWDDSYYELASRDKIDRETCFMPFEEFENDYKRRHRDLRGNSCPDPLVADKVGSAFHEAGVDQVFGEKTYLDVPRKEKWLVGIRPRKVNAGPSFNAGF
jgi:hypothetical protein